jgi:hypothetical protein
MSRHFTSPYVTSNQITAHHISHHITSPRLTSRHTISLTSHHITATHHTTSHQITSNHIKSHLVKSHNVKHKHHITSHHITPITLPHQINTKSHHVRSLQRNNKSGEWKILEEKIGVERSPFLSTLPKKQIFVLFSGFSKVVTLFQSMILHFNSSFFSVKWVEVGVTTHRFDQSCIRLHPYPHPHPHYPHQKKVFVLVSASKSQHIASHHHITCSKSRHVTHRSPSKQGRTAHRTDIVLSHYISFLRITQRHPIAHRNTSYSTSICNHITHFDIRSY